MKKYYEIKTSENNEEITERIGIGFGGFEGIRSCDPIEEWGLNEEVVEYVKKQLADGDSEITFDIEAGNWVTVQAEDMKSILEELEY